MERSPRSGESLMGVATSAINDRNDLWAWLPRPVTGARAVAVAAMHTAVATLTGMALQMWLTQQSVPLVFLLSVVLAAIGFGVTSGLSAAVFAFFAYNFFFIPPTYTFTIADPQEFFALIVFLAVALLTGSLAGRMRAVADAARYRAATLRSLTGFAVTLSEANSIAAIAAALARQAAYTVSGSAAVLLKTGDELEIRASVPAGESLEAAEWQAAQRAVRGGDVVYAAAPGWPGSRYEFWPIVAASGTIGAIGLSPSDGRRRVAPEDEVILQTMLRQVSIAIERIRLEAETAQARDEAERERIRSALLSSISHDLRTPLSSILGAVTTLRELGPSMPPDSRADLLVAIEEETGRLSRFVSNLLDMTRLDAEALDLRRDWVDAGDAAQVAVARAKRLFAGCNIVLSLVPEAPLVRGDATLLEHVVFNLIDNAVKYSDRDGRILISVSHGNGNLKLTVTDQGRGIPPEAIAHIFEKFYRFRQGHRDVPGTGLGLAICKRIVEGMGGTIGAQSPIMDGMGTKITIRLPVPESAPDASPGIKERDPI